VAEFIRSRSRTRLHFADGRANRVLHNCGRYPQWISSPSQSEQTGSYGAA
jgi:hypothetical protein